MQELQVGAPIRGQGFRRAYVLKSASEYGPEAVERAIARGPGH